MAQSRARFAGWRHRRARRVMRRSLLVTVPSFSPQVVAGSSRSAKAAVSVVREGFLHHDELGALAQRRGTRATGRASTAPGSCRRSTARLISPSRRTPRTSRPPSCRAARATRRRPTSARPRRGRVRSRGRDGPEAGWPSRRPRVRPSRWAARSARTAPRPGLPIWPVARCRLISAAFLSLPWLDWFSPWQYSDKRRRRPREPARGLLDIGRRRCRVTRSASASAYAPRSGSDDLEAVRVRVDEGGVGTSPSHSIRCSMAVNSATSVPGWIGRCRSAAAAVSVRRGSTTMSFACRARALRVLERGGTGPDAPTAVLAAGDEQAVGVVEVVVARRRRVGAERRLVAGDRADSCTGASWCRCCWCRPAPLASLLKT